MPTSTFRNEFFAPETGDGILTLLTIEHPNLTTPYRFVNNPEDVVSRTNTYTGFPFKLQLPDEKNDQVPQCEISLDNVDRILVETIRSLQNQVTFIVELVLISDPDTVEAGPFRFDLRSVSYDATQITATLQYENLLDRKFPRFAFDPTVTPTLFR